VVVSICPESPIEGGAEIPGSRAQRDIEGKGESGPGIIGAVAIEIEDCPDFVIAEALVAVDEAFPEVDFENIGVATVEKVTPEGCENGVSRSVSGIRLNGVIDEKGDVQAGEPAPCDGGERLCGDHPSGDGAVPPGGGEAGCVEASGKVATHHDSIGTAGIDAGTVWIKRGLTRLGGINTILGNRQAGSAGAGEIDPAIGIGIEGATLEANRIVALGAVLIVEAVGEGLAEEQFTGRWYHSRPMDFWNGGAVEILVENISADHLAGKGQIKRIRAKDMVAAIVFIA